MRVYCSEQRKKKYFSQSSNKIVGVIIFLTPRARVSRLKAPKGEEHQLSKKVPGTNKLRGKCLKSTKYRDKTSQLAIRNSQLATRPTRNCNSQLATRNSQLATRSDWLVGWLVGWLLGHSSKHHPLPPIFYSRSVFSLYPSFSRYCEYRISSIII